MGRKVHPIGFRLNVNRDWRGRWFAEGAQYREQLSQDFAIREMIIKDSGRAGVSRIDVERYPGKLKIAVFTAKPGILIGRKGEGIKKVRVALEELTGKKVDLDIKEIKSPDCDAYLVAHNIADQLQRRISYRRAMKRAIQQAMRQGAEGIRLKSVAGLQELKWLVMYGCGMVGYLCKPCGLILILPELRQPPRMARLVSRSGYITAR